MKHMFLLIFILPGILGGMNVSHEAAVCCQPNSPSTCTEFQFDKSDLGKDELQLNSFGGATLKMEKMENNNYVYGNEIFELTISSDANAGSIYVNTGTSESFYIIETCMNGTHFLDMLDLQHLEIGVEGTDLKADMLNGTAMEQTRGSNQANRASDSECCKVKDGIITFERKYLIFPRARRQSECQAFCERSLNLCFGYSYQSSTRTCEMYVFSITRSPGTESGPLNLTPECDAYSKGCAPRSGRMNRRLQLAFASRTFASSGNRCATQCANTSGCVRWFWISAARRCFTFRENYAFASGFDAGSVPCS